jgi:hypothetical protein
MRKALLAAGVVAVAIPLYDETALFLAEQNGGTQALPFVWKGTVAQWFGEIWLAIVGAILILLAVFL